MKTVTGRVMSSDAISLSKAASILCKFASTENGASQAVGAYLRRALAAFSELKNLHKDLKTHGTDKRSRSDVIHERNDLAWIDDELDPPSELALGKKETDKVGNLEERSSHEVSRHKKKKKKRDKAEDKNDEKEEVLENGTKPEKAKKEERKKKRKNEEEVGSEERKSNKKKRKGSEGDI